VNIGEALVVCTVLVLAVFRPDFRRFLLWAIGVGAALCVLAVGIWWGWSTYQHHVEQVASAKHHVAANACVKRLTGIDPNTTPDALPANWFTTVDACENNPAAPPQIDFSQYEKTPKMSLVEIHGGETLKVMPGHTTKDDPYADIAIPIVYLGHKQKFAFTCGVFGEQGNSPIIVNTTVTCP
jgi:hypothetical protein